jgi:3-methyladenine DNA glycosylase AlkD|tara:strand:- start:336 stop:527 length:192 start_codon:yes stop_codon:yes gene_type:complete
MFCHDTLGNYFKTNFALMQHHKYSLTELENMIPWEREIYITLLVNHLEEERQRVEQQKLANKR